MNAQSLFDVLVIGGGVNGCGIARDAAGRGLSVLLCEKDDLAQATSSASTLSPSIRAATRKAKGVSRVASRRAATSSPAPNRASKSASSVSCPKSNAIAIALWLVRNPENLKQIRRISGYAGFACLGLYSVLASSSSQPNQCLRP